jgi:hypothetical protein
MRKAQTTLNSGLKFGLKLASFAALAASLSGCLLVVTPGTPTIALTATPTSFCRGDGIERNSKLNFSFELSNISGATLQAIVAADASSNVSDPEKIPQNKLESTNSTTVANFVELRDGNYSAFVTLKMSGTNEFLSLSSVGPQAIGVGPATVRLWVRAITGSTQTNWAKSSVINAVDCP